jgi:molybdate transport system regulatory protein
MPHAPLRPTLRINLWLDHPDGLVFGHGRALLLRALLDHGSLRKAAAQLKMSYRAAWGKIKQSEAALGLALVEKAGSNKGGFRLTAQGRELMESYLAWFEEVEGLALALARERFPWDIHRFAPPGEGAPEPEPQK